MTDLVDQGRWFQEATHKVDISQRLYLFYDILDVTKDWPRLSEIFLPEAVMNMPPQVLGPTRSSPVIEGIEDITHWLQSLDPKPTDNPNRGGHVMANIVIEVDGRSATHRSTVLIGYERTNSVLMYLGRYSGAWTLTDDGWRAGQMDFALAMNLG